MRVSISHPNFPYEFLENAKKGLRKMAFSEFENTDTDIVVTVKVQDRKVATFAFVKEEDNVILWKRFISDQGYYPFEVAVLQLTKYLKRKKIKYILWNEK